jgi:hypothetical protein
VFLAKPPRFVRAVSALDSERRVAVYDALVAYATTAGYAGYPADPGIEVVEIGLFGGSTVSMIPVDPGVDEYGDLDINAADSLLMEHGFRRMFSWRQRDDKLWVALVTPAEEPTE